jgi:hypothetical protein
MRRASTSEMATRLRQHAPQPFLQEIVSPAPSTA